MMDGNELPIGAATMSPAMAHMRAYPRYLYEQIQPILGSRVWEIGVGFGTYTRMLQQRNGKILASDIDPTCLAQLQHSLGSDPDICWLRIDLCDQSSISQARAFAADSVLCFNVLEHIENDSTALQEIRESVSKGARLGLIVPAHEGLFGQMDTEAGHFRRYSRASLRRVLSDAGWKIERLKYINALGACGWWYHNRIRKSAGLKDSQVNTQMSTVDRWLPRVARWSDPILGHCFGLSVLAWGRAT
jgi:2-polyprenyl-3-methyl-5-hydroxy-6-metoxy-1,4-benzoquinol methylase